MLLRQQIIGNHQLIPAASGRCALTIYAQERKDMEQQKPSATVRLLIFAGRPDPEWALDENRTNELFAGLRGALVEKSNPPPPPGLGYRGFLVQSAHPEVPEFTVFNGVLTVGPGRKATHFRDVNGLEQLLLGWAQELGYGEALDRFGAGLRQPSQGPTSSAS